MDRKHQQNPEILRLLARSAAARSAIQREVGTLKQRLDIVGRLRSSLRSKPKAWLLGTTTVGLAAGFLFPRFRRASPPATTRSKSSTSRLLGMAWSAAQPLAKIWLANQLRSWLAQRASSPSSPYQIKPR